ncbi:1-aminocyclopropane-1-carboxylate deaminase/D-cysteine desulfhydrase [Lacimicrobium alkaliphilum]|uniref:1-aminocyclopropane-1-carboxylate deaminase n=1 Tax=Lacimicrobium alkaliphilum TaxID=1526571 RepID=A0ABQ1RF24_9ALTE|nr:pyridoxal-phosphate dependent enzyme [Lacimicrobium alkaliphilum]GGD64967.1 1-aminocyclopropane-1-carboxylate deaminase [Lacimicrobium alkaliphilum]
MTATIEQQLNIVTPSPVQRLKVNWPGSEKLRLFIKRDDLIHPVISGNKWRKLKYALSGAIDNGVTEIISFGGGHSNHLHALSYACMELDIRLIALVRGDYSEHPTATLKDLQSWATQIHFLDKKTYARRTEPDFIRQWQSAYPQALIIPEGGSQKQALAGVGEIYTELTEEFDAIVTPVGSGGTLAGLITAQPLSTLIGIGVLKGEGYLERLVTDLLPGGILTPWQILHRFHCGGYAKVSAELTTFCQDFNRQTGINIEPVYSGKLFFALQQLIAGDYFSPGSRILALHTGGLRT